MGQKISQLTALSTTYADTDLLEVSVDTGGGTFVTRKMTFLQLRTAFTKLQANLDVNSFQITSASNGNIIIRPNGSGAVLVGGNSSQATELRFMEDSDNGTNYVALKVANALAASTTYTLPTADGTSGQLLSTNGTGTLSWATAGGGLTKFTEAESTTSPNGTVYVDSLTAAGSTTNVDVAIVPKGTGAFMLDIPDNSSTGGNKRGAGAVDLQTARNSANHVASGANSFCVGTSNDATGSHSMSMGIGNSSTGTASFAAGNSCTASNTSSVALGGSVASGSGSVAVGGTTASGTGSFSAGSAVTASGQFSACIGQASLATAERAYVLGSESQATAAYSMAFGFYASAFGITGRHAYSNGNIAVIGDSQYSKFILKIRTTGNTATTLTTNGGGAGAANQVILSNQSAYRFKGSIVGKQSGSTNAAVWDIDGFIVRGANAAATTLNVSNVTLVQNTPAWGTPTLAADTTNGGLQVQVTGAAATNIQWTAAIETTEVIYA